MTTEAKPITPEHIPGLLRALAADCALEWTSKADIAKALDKIIAGLGAPK